MKKNFNNYFLTFFKTFFKTYLFLLVFNIDANASSLKISTIQACNLLEDQGLKAQLSWKKNDQKNEQWGCANKPLNSKAELPLNFSYQATGNVKEVTNIEVKAEVRDKNYNRLMQKKLLEISDIVSKKILGVSNSPEVTDAIINGKSLTLAIENFIVKISQEKISASNSYSVSFRIYSEN